MTLAEITKEYKCSRTSAGRWVRKAQKTVPSIAVKCIRAKNERIAADYSKTELKAIIPPKFAKALKTVKRTGLGEKNKPTAKINKKKV